MSNLLSLSLLVCFNACISHMCVNIFHSVICRWFKMLTTPLKVLCFMLRLGSNAQNNPSIALATKCD